MRDLIGQLEELIGQGKLAYFTDYDGVLAYFHDDPEQALVSPEIKRACLMLHCRTQEAFGFITGREMAFMDKAVFTHKRGKNSDKKLLPCSAGHGVAFRGEVGAKPVFENHVVDMALLKDAADKQSLPETLRLEWKQNALAVHYRGDEQPAAGFVEAVKQSYNAQAPDNQQVDYGQGRLVFEIGHAQANKGAAIHRFMALPKFTGKVPVYFGDTPLDNPAFEAVRDYDGICVGVGQNVNFNCDYLLSNPSEVQAVVKRLAFPYNR